MDTFSNSFSVTDITIGKAESTLIPFQILDYFTGVGECKEDVSV